MPLHKIYGLIGYPLGHSFSESYFKEKFLREGISHCSFLNFEIDNIKKISDVIKYNQNLLGFCVTIPYKEQILEYLDEIDTTAKEVKAVNVVKIYKDNDIISLKGYNTDIIGFKKSLLENINQNINYKALILGTGGASKAVAYVLRELGYDFFYVSRNESKNDKIITYEDITPEILKYHKLIVNTTPLGMYPNIYDMPDINFKHISNEHIIFDLIYNPNETMLMKQAIVKGARAINGLDMLCYQAEAAWSIWNN